MTDVIAQPGGQGTAGDRSGIVKESMSVYLPRRVTAGEAKHLLDHGDEIKAQSGREVGRLDGHAGDEVEGSP